MSDAITLDKGNNLVVSIAPPPTSSTLDGISASGNFKDISALVIGFKYWESITQLFVQAEIDILDGSGRINQIFSKDGDTCGIRKYCVVQVTFPDPISGTSSFDGYGRLDDNLTFTGTKSFYVSKIVEQTRRGTKDFYKLQLFTKDAIVNSLRRIIKSYSGTMNGIVSTVVSEQLKSSKQVTVASNETTQPVRKYLAQNILISDVIDYACKKSQATSEPGNTSQSATAKTNQSETKSVGYTFFENYETFRFSSIYRMITPSLTADNFKTYQQYEYSTLKPGELGAQKIIQISFNRGDRTGDAFTEACTGSVGNVTNKMRDPITGTPTTRISTLANKNPCDKYSFEGDANSVQYVSQEIQMYDFQYTNDCPDSGDGQKIESPSVKKNYTALLEYIRNNTAHARIPGNLSLRAGDYISINIGRSEFEYDENGNQKFQAFLITSLCHSIENVNKVYTDLELYGIRTLQ
jgi:hypothetical protein